MPSSMKQNLLHKYRLQTSHQNEINTLSRKRDIHVKVMLQLECLLAITSLERISCTWFGCEPYTRFRQRCSLASRVKLNVVRAPQMVSRLVGRVNSRALPFLSSFREFSWFDSVGGTHFKDTDTNAHEMHTSVFRTTLKAYFQRGSRTWFKIEPRCLYPSVVWCNMFRAETRTAKPLYCQHEKKTKTEQTKASYR